MYLLEFFSLYDGGHTIVGVEVAEQAVREFFIENSFEYTVEKLNKISGSLYKVDYQIKFSFLLFPFASME